MRDAIKSPFWQLTGGERMYGLIAKLTVIPGKREEMIGSGTQLKESRPPSWAALTNRRQVSPASP